MWVYIPDKTTADFKNLEYGHGAMCDGLPSFVGFEGLRRIVFQLSSFYCKLFIEGFLEDSRVAPKFGHPYIDHIYLAYMGELASFEEYIWAIYYSRGATEGGVLHKPDIPGICLFTRLCAVFGFYNLSSSEICQTESQEDLVLELGPSGNFAVPVGSVE